MEVIFVGGASGVGASCLAIRLADQWILVDAGVRVGGATDPLPDLSLLEGKDIRAIFVTHAHADHIGALPLVHRAFPTVPIFASRATGLLMEVMLADAVKIMTRRAAEEMEIPLYPSELVESMLTRFRPLPLGEPFTLPVLPDVTLHASRAGHIAGAVSLGFVAPDGSLAVSGDISITPQRTVPGAIPPPLEHCDLLVLESTYGARLHPNRQGEEQRLAQAVAEGLERGGHVLIPCFGLGRGQEILLLLQAAQEKGQIPHFPIYVDGLVRRICSTYLLMPEALTPRLQRQIRKGYLPFSGQNSNFVRDERDRERILAGPPACILSSSGMLTGGPSAKYASTLAGDPNASILITGYQDEESPGKKLLDLAEQKSSQIELNGQQMEVRCHVTRYSLSAHADGNELVNYAAQLSPHKIALVHGDDDARRALQTLIQGTQVVLPMNGTTLTLEKQASSKRAASFHAVPSLPTLPVNIGQGNDFDASQIKYLWEVVSQVPTMRIVTARELAVIWYGEATEEITNYIIQVLAEDYQQRYFVRQYSLDEAYRVRGQREDTPGDFLNDLVGNIVLIQRNIESSKPALCRAIEPIASVRVQFPKSISERTRYPLSSVLEVIGPLPAEVQTTNQVVADYLDELMKAARRVRRRISAHALARLCREGALYTLGELCSLVGVSAQTPEDRLAVAKLLDNNPQLFVQQRSLLEGEGITLYGLAPEWQEALREPEEQGRPDQRWILSVIEKHIGTPPDLYRRSIDPQTGNVTLAFHFPDVASQRYKTPLEAAAEEAGVSITISKNAHQGELTRAVQEVLPEGLIIRSLPSLYPDNHIIQFSYSGRASPESIAEAQRRYTEITGWSLQLAESNIPVPAKAQASSDQGTRVLVPIVQNLALKRAQDLLSHLPGYHRVGADVAKTTLTVRFHFPTVAQRRYADLFAQIEAETAWNVRVYPSVHQEALIATARNLLPEGLTCHTAPSLYQNQCLISLNCTGHTTFEAVREAEKRFHEETDWQLELIVPTLKGEEANHQVPQGEAMSQATTLFSANSDLYRIGLDEARKILWLHFHFPEIARERYADKLASLEKQTGWRVNLHTHTRHKALLEVAHRLLPEGSIEGSASVHQDSRRVRINCIEQLSEQMQEDLQKQFNAETGWSLDLRFSTREVPGDNRLEKTKALTLVHTTLQEVEGLQHIAANSASGVIHLKFKFPDMALQNYAERISTLEHQTGWQICIDSDVNEEALRSEVRAVLPTAKAQIDTITLDTSEKCVLVTYRGQIKASILAAAQAIFAEKTGWTLTARVL
jgi:Cft2 family RNA processing exonuclease